MGGDKETKKNWVLTKRKKNLKKRKRRENETIERQCERTEIQKMIEVKHPKKRNKGKSACAHGLKVGVAELESPRYSGSKTQAKFKDNDT